MSQVAQHFARSGPPNRKPLTLFYDAKTQTAINTRKLIFHATSSAALVFKIGNVDAMQLTPTQENYALLLTFIDIDTNPPLPFS